MTQQRGKNTLFAVSKSPPHREVEGGGQGDVLQSLDPILTGTTKYSECRLGP